MKGLYVEDGRTYLNVDIEKIQSEYGVYKINEINDLNNSLSSQGLHIVKDDNGKYKVEVIDIEAYEEYSNLTAKRTEEIENILLKDLSPEQKQEVEQVISDNNMTIDIDDIGTGSDLWEAIQGELEAAMASGGTLVDINDGTAMLVNIILGFLLDKSDLENLVLVDTDIEHFIYTGSEFISYVSTLMISNPVAIEFGLSYMATCMGMEFLPVPGARVIATIGLVAGIIATGIHVIMYTNPSEDIVNTEGFFGNGIFLNGQAIDIDYTSIENATNTFNNILNTNVLGMKMELDRLKNLRTSHIKGASERLKNYYLDNIDKLAQKIVYYNDNIMLRNYGICTVYYYFEKVDIANESFCRQPSISATRLGNEISVNVRKEYDTSNGTNSDEIEVLGNPNNTVNSEQQAEIKRVIKPHIEKIIMDYDFLEEVERYANNAVDYGISISSYDLGKQKYMNNEYLELLNTHIHTLNNQVSTTLSNLISGSKQIVELDEEIGSRW